MESIGGDKGGSEEGDILIPRVAIRVDGVEVIFHPEPLCHLRGKTMKIVDQEFDIPFKVWRKFAARRGLEYQSWEEGTEVLLNNYTRDILSDFK